jgi:hypothetical protein
MNKGKPINLYNLLDNKKYGGLYDWWEFFSKNGIEEIVDHYAKGKRQKTVINQIDYDDRPDLTRKIVHFYSKNILGDPNAIDVTTIGTDPRYEKFKETGKLVNAFWKRNKTHPLFKTEMSVMEWLFKALQTLDKPIALGSLCSDYTWKTVFPEYLKRQNMVGIKWGK